MNITDQLKTEMLNSPTFARFASTLADAMELHPLDSQDYDPAAFMQTWHILFIRSNRRPTHEPARATEGTHAD